MLKPNHMIIIKTSKILIRRTNTYNKIKTEHMVNNQKIKDSLESIVMAR